MAIFGGALVLLVRSFRRGNIDLYIFSGLSALLFAHFFQNMFVFDSVTSYILFFSVLAWAHQASFAEALPEPKPEQSVPARISASGAVIAGISVLLVGYSLVVFNAKPIRAARSIINILIIGAQADSRGKVDALISESKRGIALNTFGTTEIREQASITGNNIFANIIIFNRNIMSYT